MALVELQLLKTLVQKFQHDPLNAEFFLVRKGEGQSFIVMEALVKLAHSKVRRTYIHEPVRRELTIEHFVCVCMCLPGAERCLLLRYMCTYI